MLKLLLSSKKLILRIKLGRIYILVPYEYLNDNNKNLQKLEYKYEKLKQE